MHNDPDSELREISLGYALPRVMRTPVILLGLLAARRIAVSVAPDRSDAMQWRFQFGQRAILHMTEGAGWSWHTVTRNTRLEIEPLIREAEAIASAMPEWVEELGTASPAAPDWAQVAAGRAWAEGPSIKGGEALNAPFRAVEDSEG